MTVKPEDPARSARRPAAAPRLADGVELIGPYRGSGYREPKYLIARADGQVIQVPALLYALAQRLDGRRDLQELAAMLARDTEHELTAEQVEYLVEEKLRPVGVIASEPGEGSANTPVPARRPDPLLMLRHRVPVLPPRVVAVIAALFQPLHRPLIVLAALVGFVVVDIGLVLAGAFHELVPAATALIYQPSLTLLVFALIVLSGIFHEFGHVSACRYGGARPGSVGVGIYIVWPAMYSTVTDAYRLDRIGRLRTDLGGIYFNLIFLAGLGLAYLETGAPWLLVAVVLLHVETVWQFLPSIRLDGYYILADLVGVPDLFSFLGPVLKSALPGRAPHPRVKELKPWVRRVITLWVLIVVPLLAYWLIWFLVLLPRILPVVWGAMGALVARMTTAMSAGAPAEFTLAAINLGLLLLPPIGMTMIWSSMLRRTIVAIRSRRPRRRGKHAAPRPDHLAVLRARLRPVRWLVAALLAGSFVTGLVLAAFGRRPATAAESHRLAAAGGDLGWLDGHEAFFAHQVALLQRIWPGETTVGDATSARPIFLGLGLLGAVVLWLVARRRLGLRPPAAAAAVVLCALPAPLHDLVDAGGLAVVYLAAAALVWQRGRWGTSAAAVAAALGVLTAPLTLLGAFAVVAYLAWPRIVLRPAPRRALLGLVLVAAVAATALSVVDTSAMRPVSLALSVGIVVAGGLVAAMSWAKPSLRPVAVAAVAFLGCALLPGAHVVTALLLATPLVALLGGALLDERRHRPSRTDSGDDSTPAAASPARGFPPHMSPH